MHSLQKHVHAKYYFLKLKKKKKSVENFNVFHIFAQNIDCGYMLEPPQQEAVLTSTQNLCFEAKIREIGTCIPL